MPIPTHQSLMRPVLEQALKGEVQLGTLVSALSDELELTIEEREETVPSGKQTKITNRVSWAKTYLKQAGLLASSRRGHYIITDRGKEALADKDVRIDSAYLKKFDEFRAFQDRSSDKHADVAKIDSSQADLTPDEALREAHAQINDSLAMDLLDRVRNASPAMFESLLVKLFVAMGYGGSNEDAGRTLGRTGDDGVDGVIDQDQLGVDQIYLQAKRYAKGNNVGAGAIRDFFGALSLKRATKGIFVTTSAFSESAINTAKGLGNRIVLIDGVQLSRLMLRYSIGCRDMEVLHLKKIDEDYFDQLDELN